MFRRLVNFFIAATLVLQAGMAHARGVGVYAIEAKFNEGANVTPKVYFDSTTKFLFDNVAVRVALDEKMAKEQARTGLKVPGLGLAGDAAKLAPMLMVLAALEITRGELLRAQLEGRKVDGAELARTAVFASAKVLDNFELWTAFLSAHGTSAALHKPLQAINQMIATTAGRNFFAAFLQQAVGTTVAFLGWEAGAQLWQEAKMALTSEEDVKIANQIFISGVAASLFSNDPALKKQKELYFNKKVNKAGIFFKNTKTNKKWI